MKKLLLLFIASCLLDMATAQNAYYDAITIYKAYYAKDASLSRIALGIANKYKLSSQGLLPQSVKQRLENSIGIDRDSFARLIIYNYVENKHAKNSSLQNLVKYIKNLQSDTALVQFWLQMSKQKSLPVFLQQFDANRKNDDNEKAFFDKLRIEINLLQKDTVWQHFMQTNESNKYLKAWLTKLTPNQRNKVNKVIDHTIDTSAVAIYVDSLILKTIQNVWQDIYIKKKEILEDKFNQLKNKIFEHDGLNAIINDFFENAVDQDYYKSRVPDPKRIPTTTYSNDVNFTTSDVGNNNVQTLSNFKIPTQAQMIDALAIYVTNRFKQEMVILFAEMLKDSIAKNELLKAAFPNTLNALKAWDGNVAPKFGTGWRYAISKDLALLPDHLLNYMEQHGSGKNYINTLKDGLTIAKMVQAKYNFVEMIDFFALNDTLKSEGLQKFAKVMYIINNEMYALKDSARYWVNFKEFYKRASDTTFLHLFTNLLIAKYNKEIVSVFGKNSIERIQQQTVAFKNYLSGILLQLEHFQKNQALLAQKNDGEFSAANYWTMISGIIENTITDTLFPVQERTSKKIVDAIDNIDKIFEIYHLFEERNYAAAAHASVNLMYDFALFKKNKDLIYTQLQQYLTVVDNSTYLIKDSISTNLKLRLTDLNYSLDSLYKSTNIMWLSTTKEKLNDLTNKIAKVKEKNFDKWRENALLECNNLLENYAQYIDKIPLAFLRRTTNFISDVLKAKDGASLSKVVQAYALPPASYRLRLKHQTVIDLGAYVGVYGASEWFKQPAADRFSNPRFTFGLTAPIGFNFSWRNPKKSGYTTLSLNILDIAAAVSYRFSTAADSVSQLPAAITFAQVFSPGFFFRHSIAKTPFVWYVGTQLAPEIRSFKNTSNGTAVRFALGVAVDMPMFALRKSH